MWRAGPWLSLYCLFTVKSRSTRDAALWAWIWLVPPCGTRQGQGRAFGTVVTLRKNDGVLKCRKLIINNIAAVWKKNVKNGIRRSREDHSESKREQREKGWRHLWIFSHLWTEEGVWSCWREVKGAVETSSTGATRLGQTLSGAVLSCRTSGAALHSHSS